MKLTIPKWKGIAGFSCCLLWIILPGLNGQEVNHWESILLPGNTCRYLVPESPVDPLWKALGYEDQAWESGPGGVGYGDDDDGTAIDPAISVYCRYHFTLSEPEILSYLLLDVDFDDGFVAYLNGTELARYNMGEAGSVTAWDQEADGLREAMLYQGGLPMRFVLPESSTELLQPGDNVLAIEAHNDNPGSSDLSSNVFLHGAVNRNGSFFRATPDWFFPPFSQDSTLLPLVIIDTQGEEIPNEPKIVASMKIVDHQGTLYNHSSDPGNVYEGRIAIEMRGESSLWLFPKKSYSLETQLENGENNNVSLLGLPEENDWVLYAPYADKSLIRNVISYEIFRRMGHYSPRTRFVEVLVNNDYKGLYILTEKIKRDRNRVDMAKLRPEDITGDELSGAYLLRIDKTSGMSPPQYWESPVMPPLAGYNPVVYQYFDPDYEELNDIQREYIQDYLLEFETSLISKDYRDPAKGYRAYLDIPSFIDLMILNELTKDVDAFRLSHYFYKQKDSNGGKLVQGPPWDYNLTFGNSNFQADVHESSNWIFDYSFTIYWWSRINQDPWFRRELRCRWAELYENVLQPDQVHSLIDSSIQVMGEAIPRNFQRWPILGTHIWPNSFVGMNYPEEEEFLRNWIDERLEWMNARWNQCWPLSEEELSDPSFEEAVRVWPQPSDLSHAFVDLGGRLDPRVRIRIFDLNGRVLFASEAIWAPGELAHRLPDLSFLPDGIYTLEVRDAKAERKLCKIIKQ